MQKAETIEGKVIQFQKENAVKGFHILLHSGQCMALPNDTYVVGDDHLRLLKSERVPYKVIDSL